jgi:hypothetical protein
MLQGRLCRLQKVEHMVVLHYPIRGLMAGRGWLHWTLALVCDLLFLMVRLPVWTLCVLVSIPYIVIQ